MFKVKRDDLHHFTREANETLTRVGPATSIGNMFRQYSPPVAPIDDLSEPGGRSMLVNDRRR